MGKNDWRTSSSVKCFHSLPFQLLLPKLKPNTASTFLYIQTMKRWQQPYNFCRTCTRFCLKKTMWSWWGIMYQLKTYMYVYNCISIYANFSIGSLFLFTFNWFFYYIILLKQNHLNK